MTRKPLTEENIQRMIASDPDGPEATDAELAQAKPFDEVFPALASAMQKRVDEAFESGTSDKSLDNIWQQAKAQTLPKDS